MTDHNDTPSHTSQDPGRISIEERWAPVTGNRPGTDLPPAFRRRWLAAIISLATLIGILALLAFA
ncbi:MAG: hypothetical protein HOJ90_04575 [Alphaproteobacteria bacterium]|nr:hypothetical protein [Alphaproteobacteria bacterium]